MNENGLKYPIWEEILIIPDTKPEVEYVVSSEENSKDQ